MKQPLVEVDGALGEGGGQILRTSLALALLTGKGFHLRNIRAGRAKPGLQAQHLASVNSAAAIGQATVQGAGKGSSELLFFPGKVQPGNFHFTIGTAGAAGLVLHTLYLPLALATAPSRLTIEGGTHVSNSPCFHFLESTWQRYMALLGLQITVEMRRPGFYPRGGGLLEAQISPSAEVKELQLSRLGPPSGITGISAVAGLPEHIARRQAQRAAKRLREHNFRVDIRQETWSGGPGTVLTLVLDTTPVPTLFFALGQKGKPAERVADEAVAQVVRYCQADPPAVDPHSGDQLLLPLSLASQPSRFAVTQISEHLTTNAMVIRRFLDREIGWEGEEGQAGIVYIA